MTNCQSKAGLRTGMSLVELLVGITLNSMLALMLAGMTLAVGNGWEHTTGLDDATQQARVTIERIKYMVSQAGVYQLAGQPPVDGIAVVERASGAYRFPEILVIWSGGRNGGMVNNGVVTRLPTINELVVYAPQYDDPTRLVEIVDTTNTNNIDFVAASFGTTILSLVSATQSNKALLCDRIHKTPMPVVVGSSSNAGNVRFECLESPTNSALSGVTPGSAAWYGLVWSQGVVSGDCGLRQTAVRIELQVEQRPVGTLTNAQRGTPVNSALPFIGSTNYRYVYRP